ncbi:MAG: hypothetical protein AABY22_18340 [Nanoarchaeota archaeon]
MKINDKILKENVRRKISSLLIAGSSLSNIAFNLEQNSNHSETDREIFKRCYQKWDEVYNDLPKWMTKR